MQNLKVIDIGEYKRKKAFEQRDSLRRIADGFFLINGVLVAFYAQRNGGNAA